MEREEEEKGKCLEENKNIMAEGKKENCGKEFREAAEKIEYISNNEKDGEDVI